MVMSAYLKRRLHELVASPQVTTAHPAMRAPSAIALKLRSIRVESANSWKQVLNNLRLVIQPSVILNLLQPWLELFPIPRLSAG